MKKCLVFLLISSLFFSCFDKKKDSDNKSQDEEFLTIIIDNLPTNHDFTKDVFVSGDFEAWSGGQDQFKLEETDQSYSITIPKYKARISFKLTQGDWKSVECAENGNPIENRTYDFYKLSDTIRISIEKWTNSHQSNKSSTASENVQLYAEALEIPQLNRARKITVYLPPKYAESQESYPVLYIHDGQNVFDESTSYSGEWEVDETLNNLYNKTGFGLIVVAINHGDGKRLNEYSPWDNKEYGKGEGKQYVDFLVNTLKPKIDVSFRTKTDAENTAIMGASLGGLISHYAAFQYPDVFSKAGIFSPSYWYAEACFDFTENQIYKTLNSNIYILFGEKEGGDMVDGVEKMRALLKENAFSKNSLLIKKGA